MELAIRSGWGIHIPNEQWGYIRGAANGVSQPSDKLFHKINSLVNHQKENGTGKHMQNVTRERIKGLQMDLSF